MKLWTTRISSIPITVFGQFFEKLVLLGYWDGQYFPLISEEATVIITNTPRLVQ
jgi:hypothetical protein